MRDPEQTRRKLLDAATAEFAERGLGGARVDRIAERAGVNKRMIYAYFGNKDELFRTVLEQSLEQLIETVPMTADDLPGYAGALFDYLISHPERRRLGLWRLLEGHSGTDRERQSTHDKLDALARARRPDDALPPAAVLVFIMALVQAWPDAALAVADDSAESTRAAQRASVVEAVRRLFG